MMTSTPPDHPRPEPSDESGAAAGRAPGANAPTAEQSAVPPGGADPAAAAPAPGPGYQPPYPGGPYPPQAPFAAVPRPPRVPWVNPDRRSHVVGAGVLGGLVVLAAGFGIGYAVAPSGHDGRGPGLRIERGGAYFPGRMVPGPAGQFPVPGNRQRRLPGAPAASSAAPTAPTPTSTK
jgi:hypothetical protein